MKPTAVPDKYRYLWLALLLVLAAALFWPGMTSRPLLDDKSGLAHVSEMTSWKETLGPDCFGLLRPIKNIVFYLFRNLDPMPLMLWHGFNLACFLAALVSVYFLVRRLFGSDRWALAAAAVWALTPTQVSTAVWMSCFNISVAIVFISLFLQAHMKSVAREKTFTSMAALAGIAMFLAQMSYEAAVSAMGLAFLCDHIGRQPPALRKRIAHYGFYFAVTIAYLAIRHYFGASIGYRDGNAAISPNVESWQLAVSAPWLMMKHLMMWLSPLGRMEILGSYIWGESASMGELVFAWILMSAIALTGLLLWKRSPWLAFGILWFFVAAFPSSNLVPIFAGPVEDYYLAIPSIGLAIALAGISRQMIVRLQQGGDFMHQRSRMAAVMVLALLATWRAAYVPFVPMQAAMWNRPLEIYLQSAASRNFQLINLALAAKELQAAGRNEEALALVGQAEKIGGWFAAVPMVKGYALARGGRLEPALAALQRAVDLAPEKTMTSQACRVYIGQIHLQLGHGPDVVREALRPVLDHGQKEYRVQAILAMTALYLKEKNSSRAIATIDRGLALFPGEPSLAARGVELAANQRAESSGGEP